MDRVASQHTDAMMDALAAAKKVVLGVQTVSSPVRRSCKQSQNCKQQAVAGSSSREH